MTTTAMYELKIWLPDGRYSGTSHSTLAAARAGAARAVGATRVEIEPWTGTVADTDD